MRVLTAPRLAVLAMGLFTAIAFSQDGVVQRKVNLRKDPSTSHPAIGVLLPDQNVQVLDTSTSARYVKVKTEDKKVGWVLKSAVQVFDGSAPAAGAGGPGGGTPDGTPNAISPDWPKPKPVTVAYNGAEGSCPAGGQGGDTATNLLKNRSDDLPEVHDVSWSSLANLAYPAAPASRADWTKAQLAQIAKYEGEAIRTVGYLGHKPKVEDSGTGESTNCKYLEPDDVDWHIYLAGTKGDTGLEKTVIVETTPRIRQKVQWDFAVLERYVGKGPVRISGFLMLDPEHRSQVGSARGTVWEIHPVMKIEVCETDSCSEGEWKDLNGLK